MMRGASDTMLHLFVAANILLQFQVTYSSYTNDGCECKNSDANCDSVISNAIPDDRLSCKEPKGTIEQLNSKFYEQPPSYECTPAPKISSPTSQECPQDISSGEVESSVQACQMELGEQERGPYFTTSRSTRTPKLTETTQQILDTTSSISSKTIPNMVDDLTSNAEGVSSGAMTMVYEQSDSPPKVTEEVQSIETMEMEPTSTESEKSTPGNEGEKTSPTQAVTLGDAPPLSPVKTLSDQLSNILQIKADAADEILMKINNYPPELTDSMKSGLMSTEQTGAEGNGPSLPSVGSNPSLPSLGSSQSLPLLGSTPSLPLLGSSQSLPLVGSTPSLPLLGSSQSLPLLGSTPSLPLLGSSQSLPLLESSQEMDTPTGEEKSQPDKNSLPGIVEGISIPLPESPTESSEDQSSPKPTSTMTISSDDQTTTNSSPDLMALGNPLPDLIPMECVTETSPPTIAPSCQTSGASSSIITKSEPSLSISLPKCLINLGNILPPIRTSFCDCNVSPTYPINNHPPTCTWRTIRPVYQDVIQHVPVLKKVIRNRVVETTRHVPIIEKHIVHEKTHAIRHVPVVQKCTRNVIEYNTNHVPVVRHRTRTVQDSYTEHVPVVHKFTRPVVETVIKHVPVVYKRYKPILNTRVRHIPVVETRYHPVIEETITTVPVKRTLVKNINEEKTPSVFTSCSSSTSVSCPTTTTLLPEKNWPW